MEKLHQGANHSDESMEFLYIDVKPDTKIEFRMIKRMKSHREVLIVI